MLATQRSIRRRLREVESLEHRWLLTQDFAISDPVLLFEAEADHEIVAHQFVDLNNDSVKELVVAQNRTDSIVGRVTLLAQDGAGRFQPVSERATGKVFDLEVVGSGATPQVILHHNGELHSINVQIADDAFQLEEPTVYFESERLNEWTDWELVDLNGDGIDDVTMSVFWTEGFENKWGTVIQLANGDGTFQQEVRYEFDQIVDINGDSFPDAVRPRTEVSIVLNDGRGTFDAPPTVIDTVSYQWHAQDLNGDSLTDLINVNYEGISVRHGNADFGFDDAKLILPATEGWDGNGSIRDLAFNDVDGDGDLDIYVGSEDIVSDGYIGPRLLMYDGGRYEIMSTANSWSLPAPIDIVGDARAEFVYATPTKLSFAHQIKPLSIRKQVIDLPNKHFRVMDATNDGVPDIVMVVERGLAVVQQDDMGGFQETIIDLDHQFTNRIQLNQLVEGDNKSVAFFEERSGDGVLTGKLHIVRFVDEQWLVEELELGDLAGWTLFGFPAASDGLKFEDLNNDGVDDLILGRPDSVVAYMSTGDGWLPTEVLKTMNPFVNEVIDIDGDGRLDLLVDSRSQILSTDATHVALNRGDDGWLLAEPIVFEEKRAITTLLDVNGDDVPDLVNQATVGSGSIEVAILLPDGSVDQWPPPPSSSRWSKRTADFNGDGLQDFHLTAPHNDFVVSFDLETRQWTVSRLRGGTDWDIEFIDHDSDGDLDITDQRCPYTDSSHAVCSITAFLNDGQGQFTPEVIDETVLVPRGRRIDLNDDGIDEILSFGEQDMTVYRLYDEGWLVESEADVPAEFADHEVRELDVRDVNGDGINDLVITQGFYKTTGSQHMLSYGLGNLEFTSLINSPGDEFSGDGLVYGTYGGALTAWGETGGRFDGESVLAPNSGFNDASTFVDLDNDGDQDFVVPSRDGVTIIYQIDPGDFDDDGESTLNDLALIYASLGARTSATLDIYDLNHDYAIDQLDIDFWITHSAKTLRGDANLDGSVDFVDFLALAENFGKVDDGLRWNDGDFNGDGTVNFIDFLALAENFGDASQ